MGRGQRPHRDVVIARWNDLESVETAFATDPEKIAAVICEPLLCNSGCIPPKAGFLEFLREITLRHRAVLIFDEVITGFRIHLQGAQGLYGVVPDLATFGKAVGGGVALSVFGPGARLDEFDSRRSGSTRGHTQRKPARPGVRQSYSGCTRRDDAAVLKAIERNGERLRLGF